MLILEKSLKLDELIASSNIAEDLPDSDRTAIAAYVHTNWTLDQQSRSDWEKRMADAMELAMQVPKDKTFPWPNCSNVKFSNRDHRCFAVSRSSILSSAARS